MSEIVFPSTKAGNEVDRAVTAALSTIPGQITQINTRVTALEEDVDDLSGLPAQVTQIGLKLGDLANLTTTAKNNIVAAVNEVKDELELQMGETLTASYDGYSETTAGTAYNATYVVANKYAISGIVTKLRVYCTISKGSINYGTLDVSGSDYVWTSKGTAVLVQGLNVISCSVNVSENLVFAIENVTAQSICFVSGGVGRYMYNTSWSTPSTEDDNYSYQYSLEYQQDNTIAERLSSCESGIDDLTDEIYGNEGEYVPIEPTEFAYNSGTGGTQTNRWRIEWTGTIKQGDVISISCTSGYAFFAGILTTDRREYETMYTDSYQSTALNLTYQGEDGRDFRILVKKSDDSDLTSSEVRENVTYSLSRLHATNGILPRLEVLEEKKQTMRILFIGNSLTQDAISYVPLLLKNLAPDVDFKFYVWYNGGKDLAQQLAYFTNNTVCEIFSVCENATSWTNYNSSKTMASILATYDFDIVCLQEYFNYKSSYTDSDKAAYNSIIDYIHEHYDGTFKVVTLLHQPLRSSADNVFSLTKDSIDWILENTVTESCIPAGYATYLAMSTELDSLGDQGHLSPDGTHSQEGLPCMLQAYVSCLWMLRQLAIPKGILNNSVRVTASNYAAINVPGPNLGTGVVEGTAAQNWLAQQVATKAFTNDAHYVESTAITNIVSLTQSQYDALATKDSNTLYIIV